LPKVNPLPIVVDGRGGGCGCLFNTVNEHRHFIVQSSVTPNHMIPSSDARRIISINIMPSSSAGIDEKADVIAVGFLQRPLPVAFAKKIHIVANGRE
jgi:hypothetical protein